MMHFLPAPARGSGWDNLDDLCKLQALSSSLLHSVCQDSSLQHREDASEIRTMAESRAISSCARSPSCPLCPPWGTRSGRPLSLSQLGPKWSLRGSALEVSSPVSIAQVYCRGPGRSHGLRLHGVVHPMVTARGLAPSEGSSAAERWPAQLQKRPAEQRLAKARVLRLSLQERWKPELGGERSCLLLGVGWRWVGGEAGQGVRHPFCKDADRRGLSFGQDDARCQAEEGFCRQPSAPMLLRQLGEQPVREIFIFIFFPSVFLWFCFFFFFPLSAAARG